MKLRCISILFCLLINCTVILAATSTTSTVFCLTRCSASSSVPVPSTTITQTFTITSTTTALITPTVTITPRASTYTYVDVSAIYTSATISTTTISYTNTTFTQTETTTTTTSTQTQTTTIGYATTITAPEPAGFLPVQSTLPDSANRKKRSESEVEAVAEPVAARAAKALLLERDNSCPSGRYPSDVICLDAVEVIVISTVTRTASPSTVTASRPTTTKTITTTITYSDDIIATSTIFFSATYTFSYTLTAEATFSTTVTTSIPTFSANAACDDPANYASTINGNLIVDTGVPFGIFSNENNAVFNPRDCCNLCFNEVPDCAAFESYAQFPGCILYVTSPNQPGSTCTAPDQWSFYAYQNITEPQLTTPVVVGNGKCGRYNMIG